jgi:hypothetical protein
MLKIVWVVVVLLATGAAAYRACRSRLQEAGRRIIVAALKVMAILYIGFSPLMRTKRG